MHLEKEKVAGMLLVLLGFVLYCIVMYFLFGLKTTLVFAGVVVSLGIMFLGMSFLS
jgi:hypothetical protein